MADHGVRIVDDDLSGHEVRALLRFHTAEMERNSPPGGCHYLDLDALRNSDVSFWSIWDGPLLAGCGALREVDPALGEVKSMRTAPEHVGRGVGRQMLNHIIAVATARRYERLCLETGSGNAFVAAIRLYESEGFEATGPFGDYTATEFSRFYGLDLGRR